MNPLILSGSSLNVWATCPRQWWYGYILAKQTKPSYKMALGVAAHEAVELAMRWNKNTGGGWPPIETWTDAFDAHWTELTRDVRPKNHQPAESNEAHRASGRQAVAFYAREIAPTLDIVAFEEPMAITINDHVWTGTIDLIDRMPGGGLRLRDHKFTSTKPTSTDRYKRPMIGYLLGAREKYGDIESIQIDYIVRGNQNRPPTFMPMVMTISQADILSFATEVEAAVTSINAGRFPPVGSTTGACRFCPYRTICPDATY